MRFAPRMSPQRRARHKAWRNNVRERLCIEAGSEDDRHLSRIIIAWRTLRAQVLAMERHGHPVPPEDREQLTKYVRLLGPVPEELERKLEA